MDLKNIKAIYKFLKYTDIVELEVECPDGKVRIRRALSEEAAVKPAKLSQGNERAKETNKEELQKMENIKTITSPMVGTFYSAPSPEAPPFVETGTIVKGGQGLCIIEAMKIMNEVESEYTGKIVSVLVENGQPVEYGEPLFYIEIHD
jgi:acetyl-CoA carboxylase biotin carboxyl carrier protein